jgi:serine/threonine-protein kinase
VWSPRSSTPLRSASARTPSPPTRGWPATCGNSHRYNAARAAALAGCGQGKDADKLDEKERARLRQRAREWLRADLALWAKQADNDNPKAREAVQQQLKHWQTDADLAGVRDKDALAKLPGEEQEAWRKLWGDVSAVLKRASDPR